MPYSRRKADVARVLKEEGYIEESRLQEAARHALRIAERPAKVGGAVDQVEQQPFSLHRAEPVRVRRTSREEIRRPRRPGCSTMPSLKPALR